MRNYYWNWNWTNCYYWMSSRCWTSYCYWMTRMMSYCLMTNYYCLSWMKNWN